MRRLIVGWLCGLALVAIGASAQTTPAIPGPGPTTGGSPTITPPTLSNPLGLPGSGNGLGLAGAGGAGPRFGVGGGGGLNIGGDGGLDNRFGPGFVDGGFVQRGGGSSPGSANPPYVYGVAPIYGLPFSQGGSSAESTGAPGEGRRANLPLGPIDHSQGEIDYSRGAIDYSRGAIDHSGRDAGSEQF